MINMQEVLETNNMIAHEKLDVRTITLGISLLDCVDSNLDALCDKIYRKITSLASNLVATGRDIERDFGVPVKKTQEAEKKTDLRADRQDRNIGVEVGDICPICLEGIVEEIGGCNTCTNCNAQLKCGL